MSTNSSTFAVCSQCSQAIEQGTKQIRAGYAVMHPACYEQTMGKLAAMQARHEGELAAFVAARIAQLSK